MTLALSNHLGLQSGLQFFESHRLESVWHAAVRHHGRIWEAFQIQSNSTLPGTFCCFQGNELTHKAHYNFQLTWMSLEEKQKYTGDIGDMIPITVYTSLKSPCRDISYPFISSVTCKLLQVLLKFFHLLPDRLHLASRDSTARINGLFLTRWRAVLGKEPKSFVSLLEVVIAKKNGSTQSQHLYTNLWNQKTNRPLATCLSGSPRTVNNQHDKTSAGIWWIHHSLKPAMPKIKRPGNAV